ncbi:MAG TPA: acetylglutamate kinase [Thermoanaerobaculia bacterium]
MRASTPLSVVKLGGSLLENATMRGQALEAIAAAFTSGERLVMVHGGGKEIDRNLSVLGIPKRMQGGLRITDPATLDVVVKVLSGTINKSLVGQLQERGVVAAGLSGADGGTLFAEFHPPVDGVDLGFVGRVVSCSPALVEAILGAGLLPAVASIALGRDGVLLNVNADSAASALAGALKAQRLVFMTDVEGVKDASGHVLDRLTAAEIRYLLGSSVITGGMRPKLQACLEALEAGVNEVIIAGPERHATVLVDGKGGTHLVAA